MFNKIRQSHSDMESNITAAIVVLLAVFAIAVSMIGAINFANHGELYQEPDSRHCREGKVQF